MLGEHARAVANVLCECFKQSATFDVVSGVNGAVHVAETASGAFARFRGGHPGPDVGLDLQLEMRAHFAIDVIDNRLALSQRPQAIAKNSEPLHFSILPLCAYVACRTFAIASTSRSQLASCVSSCFRPARVSL